MNAQSCASGLQRVAYTISESKIGAQVLQALLYPLPVQSLAPVRLELPPKRPLEAAASTLVVDGLTKPPCNVPSDREVV